MTSKDVKLADSKGLYDLVFAIKVVEHAQNPRSFLRFASMHLKVGGKPVVTTPNCASLSSLFTLVLQGQFRDFRDGAGMYPSHITPVLPADASRLVREAGLEVVSLSFSNNGRIPFTSRPYQSVLPFLGGKPFSDNYRLIGVRALSCAQKSNSVSISYARSKTES